MKQRGLIAGIFVVASLLLFSVGLFLIGDSHQAFSHHVTFYTEMFDVNGLAPGLRVRVAGYAAGQVKSIAVACDDHRIMCSTDGDATGRHHSNRAFL